MLYYHAIQSDCKFELLMLSNDRWKLSFDEKYVEFIYMIHHTNSIKCHRMTRKLYFNPRIYIITIIM